MPPDEQGIDREWVLSVLEQYEARLVRYAARITGDEDAARDVVQHAFLRLCDASRADVAEHVGEWLYTVCHHRAIDLLRRTRREEPLVNGQAEEWCGRDIDPASAAEQRDSARQIQKVVGTLPDSQQQVVHLWSEGFAYREISRVTGQTEGYVRVLMHRALAEIRRHPLTMSLARGLTEESPALARRCS